MQETEGVDFKGALELLADRYGVELEREQEDPREAERRKRRERLLELLARTAAYYERCLWESGEAERAREYLAGRGLGEEILREFRVGYAPSAWDRVLTASRRGGFSEAGAYATGSRSARRRTGGPTTASARGSCSRSPTSAGGCSASARARMREEQRPEVPEHLRQRRLPQGAAPLRRRPRARPRRARRAGDPVRGLHRRDRPAPGGHAQRGRPDGHGADGRAGGRAGADGADGAARARRRQRRTGGDAARRRRWRRNASSSCAWCRCPPAPTRRSCVQRDGAEAIERAVDAVGAVRALPRRARARGRRPLEPRGSRPHARGAAPDLRDAPAERDAHGADAHGLRAAGAAREPRRDAARRDGRAAAAAREAARQSVHGRRARRPAAALAGAVACRGARTPSGRSSRCASPRPRRARRRSASLDVDEHFASELLRRAARHLREGDLREPMADPPAPSRPGRGSGAEGAAGRADRPSRP